MKYIYKLKSFLLVLQSKKKAAISEEVFKSNLAENSERKSLLL